MAVLSVVLSFCWFLFFLFFYLDVSGLWIVASEKPPACFVSFGSTVRSPALVGCIFVGMETVYEIPATTQAGIPNVLHCSPTSGQLLNLQKNFLCLCFGCRRMCLFAPLLLFWLTSFMWRDPSSAEPVQWLQQHLSFFLSFFLSFLLKLLLIQ